MDTHPEIPIGFYCYTIERVEYGPKTPITKALSEVFGEEDKGEIRIVTKTCPHWGCDPTKPKDMNGFCRLLHVNDWEHGTLLWDQVKSCKFNEGDLTS